MSSPIKFEIPGGTLTIHQRSWYVGGRLSEMSKAPRLYVSVADETIMENLENRKRRPYNVYKTLIHSSGLSDIINIDKLSWNQHAGCTMCPCSPGFILNHQSIVVGDAALYRWDAWLTLENAPSIDPSKHARVLELI